MAELVEIDEIARLKHAYLRLLDTKQFDELGALLTEDATSAYASGELSHRGRDAIVAFLQGALGDRGIVTMHTGHQPEITLTSATTATGRWYLEDRVIVPGRDFELHGTALYRDEYRKEAGRWRISHTGYDRIFEEQRRRSTGEVLSFSSPFHAAESPGAEGGAAPRSTG
jgi:ketosteroid isomerase-like protein